jgi:hypothetical protein
MHAILLAYRAVRDELCEEARQIRLEAARRGLGDAALLDLIARIKNLNDRLDALILQGEMLPNTIEGILRHATPEG